jgi:hypothetical protein
MERLEELSKPERILRFRGILKEVVGVDDLFPPDSGVREPVRPRFPIYPKIGAVALELPSQSLVLNA